MTHEGRSRASDAPSTDPRLQLPQHHASAPPLDDAGRLRPPDPTECPFNYAQSVSKSNRLLQGSQWSGTYVSTHLKMSPSQDRERKRSIEQLLNHAGCRPSSSHDPNTVGGDERDDTCSRIILYDQGECGEMPACAETSELPPRIEAFELPCYFSKRPQRILLVLRTNSDDVTAVSVVLATWLQRIWEVSVCVELGAVSDMEALGAKDLEVWDGEFHASIDLVVSLGGDGTTLWISTMFPDVVPPVVGVTMGSLSYLNQFRAEELFDVMAHILSCQVFRVQLRSRLFVMLVDDNDHPITTSHCVNEVVVDRGPTSAMALVDVYVNDRFFTAVAADGLILAAPTGSTAYSMSAGGAMVHPNVPCILFTPICPHSLSMRPLILPDNAVIRLRNPQDARNSLWISADGRPRRECKRGQSIVVSLSQYPFPLVCKSTCECGDAWMQALTDNLNWNLRVRQRGHDALAGDHLITDEGHTKSVLEYPLPPNMRRWWKDFEDPHRSPRSAPSCSSTPNPVVIKGDTQLEPAPAKSIERSDIPSQSIPNGVSPPSIPPVLESSVPQVDSPSRLSSRAQRSFSALEALEASAPDLLQDIFYPPSSHSPDRLSSPKASQGGLPSSASSSMTQQPNRKSSSHSINRATFQSTASQSHRSPFVQSVSRVVHAAIAIAPSGKGSNNGTTSGLSASASTNSVINSTYMKGKPSSPAPSS